jgi:hypothetical protein
MIGEGLMIGAAVLLGGLTLRYIQKHPFYKHPSQKFKDVYQAKLHHALQDQFSANEAYWVARALTDHLFDFGKRTYEDHQVELRKAKALDILPTLYRYHIEAPTVLCQQLVGRALELKVPNLLFFSHMRALWQNYLIPAGKLTPNLAKIANSSEYENELKQVPTSMSDVTRFLEKTQ